MKNEYLIAKAAVESGLYTFNEALKMIETGEEIPLHTINRWNEKGNFKVKQGENGIEVHLWKRTEDGSSYYKTKALLYRKDQLEEKNSP